MSDVIEAHKYSRGNRTGISLADRCGCFSCISVFPASEVREFIDRSNTALCPRCGVDAVLHDFCGYPTTDVRFLEAMYSHWFEHE